MSINANLHDTLATDPGRRSRAGAGLRARSEMAEGRRLEAELRAAVSAGEFLLHYQPRICLRDGAIRGVEALLRWPHGRRGNTPPATFLPVAERSGLIHEIGAWVLRTACTEAAQWPGGAVAPRISVNIAAAQFEDGAVLRDVAAALEITGLPPERLELEFTEALLAETDEETFLALAALRDQGVGLVLDDFGDGLASLLPLRRLPLTALKLGRTLTRGLPRDPEDLAIARAIVETGHALGLSVLGAGIETEAELQALRAIGCDEGQGYLFCRPMAAEPLRARLAG
ncbi:MAG TPA: EAL domain-containing protein [Acetobacteraceae bacterium]|nr:EAL domain-containing protein [Acetobacteraceae bacterium]